MRLTIARRLGGAGLIALGVLPFASITASAKPAVRLTLPGSADAGIAIQYSFTAARVPPRSKLVIQRQMGTANRFRTVATLRRTPSGTGKLPGLRLGRHRLRIAVIGRNKASGKSAASVVLAQQRKTLTVFDDVPFSTLFSRSGRGGTHNTPTRTFSYAFARRYPQDGTGFLPTVDKANNTCKSVHVDFVVARNGSGEMGTLSVVQESRDPVATTAPVAAISAVDAPLTPGEAWSIAVGGADQSGVVFYVNGTANCYSQDVL